MAGPRPFTCTTSPVAPFAGGASLVPTGYDRGLDKQPPLLPQATEPETDQSWLGYWSATPNARLPLYFAPRLVRRLARLGEF
jgi:hypothetical protein